MNIVAMNIYLEALFVYSRAIKLFVNSLIPKYLFKNETPKTNPVKTNTSRRPIIEYAQSLFVKDLMFTELLHNEKN